MFIPWWILIIIALIIFRILSQLQSLEDENEELKEKLDDLGIDY
jgi:cell shape-determining protein MreC